MSKAMQLKDRIKNIAKSKNISAQIVMQNYMLERLLERISLSAYSSNFILKGGLLIAAMVGLDSRATMDMDTTIRNVELNVDTMTDVFKAICSVPMADEVEFSIKRAVEIREAAEYTGVRISIEAKYHTLITPLKIDISTGDKVTPKEIMFKFNLMFEPRSIDILAYNLETVLSEKLETVISRSVQSTRPRDYYDIYMLYKFQSQNLDKRLLKEALLATASYRQSLDLIKQYPSILEAIINSDAMSLHWKSYQSKFSYAKDIDFVDVCISIKEILDSLQVV